jgi:hypothetical protein
VNRLQEAASASCNIDLSEAAEQLLIKGAFMRRHGVPAGEIKKEEFPINEK